MNYYKQFQFGNGVTLAPNDYGMPTVFVEADNAHKKVVDFARLNNARVAFSHESMYIVELNNDENTPVSIYVV